MKWPVNKHFSKFVIDSLSWPTLWFKGGFGYTGGT